MKYNEIVKSINYDQHEILKNIIDIHNGGKPFDCDLTYSKGKFYGEFKNENGELFNIDQPKYKFDVYPQVEGVEKIEPFGNLPLDNNTLESVIIDLPFLIGIGPSLKETDEKKEQCNAQKI